MSKIKDLVIDEMNEVWKQVFDWHYEVSDYGRVRNTNTGNLVSQYTIGDNNTRYVTMSNHKDRATMTVPKLVMIAFNEEYANNPESYRIIFKDKDRKNCKLDNLDIVHKKIRYTPISPVLYSNDIWIWIKTDEIMMKKKKKICSIIANGISLYEHVYIDEVTKHDRHTYELWGHEVKDNKEWEHSTIEIDLTNEENRIKNTMIRK